MIKEINLFHGLDVNRHDTGIDRLSPAEELFGVSRHGGRVCE